MANEYVSASLSLSPSASLFLSCFLCSSSPCYPLFTVRTVQSGLSHTQSHYSSAGHTHTHTKAHTCKNTHMWGGSHTETHLHWKRMNIHYTKPYIVIVCLIILFYFFANQGCLFIHTKGYWGNEFVRAVFFSGSLTNQEVCAVFNIWPQTRINHHVLYLPQLHRVRGLPKRKMKIFREHKDNNS